MKRRDATRENADNRKRDREIRKATHPARQLLSIAKRPQKVLVLFRRSRLLVQHLHTLRFSYSIETAQELSAAKPQTKRSADLGRFMAECARAPFRSTAAKCNASGQLHLHSHP